MCQWATKSRFDNSENRQVRKVASLSAQPLSSSSEVSSIRRALKGEPVACAKREQYADSVVGGIMPGRDSCSEGCPYYEYTRWDEKVCSSLRRRGSRGDLCGGLQLRP